ncbi:transposase [Actinacidiphila glaucinigra]|uniref:transposase n=1 Tax=Actinacidiphila glaucinigra TaxID=235986 RepID=UPI0037F931B7
MTISRTVRQCRRDHPVRVRRYPSDRTDAEWALVRTALSVLACLEGRGGRPEGYCHREMPDAVFYLVDNGITWRAMPADSPAWDQGYAFFRRWRDGALVTELHPPAARPGPRTGRAEPPEPRQSQTQPFAAMTVPSPGIVTGAG